MSTATDQRPSLRSVWRVSWRLASFAAAGALALVIVTGLALGRDDQDIPIFTVLAASIAVGPFLILPMTRKIVWLVVAGVAGLVITAALVRFL